MNAILLRYVQDLAVSVAQRDKISGLSSTKDALEGDEQEFRLQELVWRRLVLEEARQQVLSDLILYQTQSTAIVNLNCSRRNCIIAYVAFFSVHVSINCINSERRRENSKSRSRAPEAENVRQL
jgi:hypothetical protein